MKNLLVSLLFIILFINHHAAYCQPDSTTNRYATSADAAHWHNVNEEDYIFFQGNVSADEIYAGGGNTKIKVGIGKKIHIFRGEYKFIFIDGELCENSDESPTVITNLGGQVKWGYHESATNTRRTLELTNFKHVFVTGKYDKEAQTGHNDYRGHDGGHGFRIPDYHMKYGLWGNPKWSGIRFRNDQGVENIVRIRDFSSAKVSYVAATEGGFAGFNIKSDNPKNPTRVSVDIQDCFSGWTEGEGYYVGYTANAFKNDFIKLTFKNNIAVFNGAEAIQTVKLGKGTIEENNVALFSGAFYRRPFQAGGFQDGLHQFNFVEGPIISRNNIMTGGDLCHTIRFEDSGDRKVNTSQVGNTIEISNSYYGYSRANVSYIWEGDGTTQYHIKGNYYDAVPNDYLVDSFDGSDFYGGLIRNANRSNPITVSNNTFSEGREIIQSLGSDSDKLIVGDNVRGDSPNVAFMNTGFSTDVDYSNISFWTAKYNDNTHELVHGQFVPYEVGDNVFFYDSDGLTKYFKCTQAHQGNFNPNTSKDKWEEISWNGLRLPPLDLRLVNDSFYDLKGMGVTYEGVPNAEISVTHFQYGALALNRPSSTKSYMLKAEILSNLEITIPAQVTLSTDGVNFVTGSLIISPENGYIEKEIFVRINPTELGPVDGAITHSAKGVDVKKISLDATVFKVLSNDLDQDNKLNIYPIPSQGKFKIDFNDESVGEVKIDIFDLSGKLTWSEAVLFDKGLFEFDLILDVGLYEVKLEANNAKFFRRLLIEK